MWSQLHFTGLSLLVGTVVILDLRLIGVVSSISYQGLQKLTPLGIAGFGLNVLTGTMFLVTAPDQYLYNPAFISKMLIIALAGLNVGIFYGFCYPRQPAPDAETKFAPQSTMAGRFFANCMGRRNSRRALDYLVSSSLPLVSVMLA